MPIIRFSDSVDSQLTEFFFGERGVRGYGELDGVNLIPRPVFAATVLELEGVEDMF